jgi:DNA-3-methyladenine glycosylase
VTLARSFLARRATDVAPGLLGAFVVAGPVVVRITEVEAYEGGEDAASHAYRGPTARNGVMFGPAGHLYVYFTYGMHWCANVVCGTPGVASAVLLRAGEVLEGLDVARARRPAARRDVDLARGPARLASCLAVDRSHDGVDLCDPAGGVRLEPATSPAAATDVVTGPRVGLTRNADAPLRFSLAGEPTVSVWRPGGKTRRGGAGGSSA